MKKLLILAAAVLALGLFGCDVVPCQHEFGEAEIYYNGLDKKVEMVTCTKCNESEYRDVCIHSWDSEVVVATCETRGCTLLTCSACGDEREDNVQPALGHSYEYSYTDADTHLGVCSTCQDECSAVHAAQYESGCCEACGALVMSTGALSYSVEEDFAVLTGYDAPYERVKIADCYNDVPVTVIETMVFKECAEPVEVIIPATVKEIKASAFWECNNLTKVVLSDGMTGISKEAFWRCSNLEYNEHAGGLYLGTATNPYYALMDANGVLEEIHPDTKIIASYAFSNSGVTSVIIPDGVFSLGSRAFSNCAGLTCVTFPATLTAIDRLVFLDCVSLQEIAVAEGNPNYKAVGGNLYTKDGSKLVQYAPGKTNGEFVLPQGVEVVGDGAFRDTSVVRVVLNDGVTKIDEDAFRDCADLTDIVLGGAITEIGDNAFSGCVALTDIVLPETLTSIGSNAFNSCRLLVEAVIPASVTYVGDFAFVFCDGLQGVEFVEKEGWSSETLLGDVVPVQSEALEDKETVATLLTGEWRGYKWTKID